MGIGDPYFLHSAIIPRTSPVVNVAQVLIAAYLSNASLSVITDAPNVLKPEIRQGEKHCCRANAECLPRSISRHQERVNYIKQAEREIGGCEPYRCGTAVAWRQ